jgi:hypothetical protein
MDLGSDHAECSINRGLDSALDRIIEAWPSRPAFEFPFGFEQGLATTGA